MNSGMKVFSRFDLILFFKYFFGYLVLFLPIVIFIFNGRALLAQANWSLKQTLIFQTPNSQEVSPDTFNQVSASGTESFVFIPKINVKAEIVFPDTTDNKELLSWLEKGVIHYPDSAGFGEKGVGILLGHSSAYPWYRGDYGSVFALLEKLEPGDEVVVVSQGKKYLYRVSGSKVVVPKDFRVENPDNGSHLWLMSCWPVRTNKLRIVVATDLVKTESI
ncbi:MAG: sortase [Patescibacteria group bacterium]